MGLGFVLFVAMELTLRILGIAAGDTYAPPRLIQVVKEGKIQGEFVQQSRPYFDALNSNQVQVSSIYRQGKGDGFPASGSMRNLRFKKSPTADRYFLLGGSAALGQNPVNLKTERSWKTVALGKNVTALDEPISISGQIRSQMAATGKEVEILNAGMIAQDSGGVRRIAMEALQYAPKGLLLYLGNNEGIGLAYGMQGEELPLVPEVRTVFHTLRSYRILSDWILPMRQRHGSTPAPLKGTKPEVLGQLTLTQWRAAGYPLINKKSPSDSVYQALMERFEQNLRAIILAAKEKGVSVIIVPTAPHLGYPPFFDANDPTLIESDIQQYTQLIGAARSQMENHQWELAEQSLKDAIRIDKTHATAWFMLGKTHDAQGQYDDMLVELNQALILDISRKRSLPGFYEVSKGLCLELGCQTSSPLPSLDKNLLSDGMSWYNTIYGDHEHLTPSGCSWIAEIFVQEMVKD